MPIFVKARFIREELVGSQLTRVATHGNPDWTLVNLEVGADTMASAMSVVQTLFEEVLTGQNVNATIVGAIRDHNPSQVNGTHQDFGVPVNHLRIRDAIVKGSGDVGGASILVLASRID